MEIVSLIAFVVFIAGLLTSSYTLIRFRNKYIKAQERYVQALIDKKAIEDKLTDLIQEGQNKDLEQTDGFVKFITQSRDWAFEYIEETQSVLSNFVEKVGPLMAYYDKYGRIQESESMNKIFDAYSELMKVLPETNNKQGENNE
jgi:hypothetical protein